VAVLVHLLALGEDALVGVVVLGRDDGKHDRALLRQVVINEGVDELDIGLGLHLLCGEDQAWQINESQLRAAGSCDLDTEHIAGEGLGAADIVGAIVEAHQFSRSFNELWQLTEVGDGLAEGFELRLLGFWARLIWDDLGVERLRLIAAKDDLCGKASTETLFAREWDFGDGFEHGGLARRLVAADDELWKRQDGTQTAGAQAVNDIENLSILDALQVIDECRCE
jgi:hypothetical protein